MNIKRVLILLATLVVIFIGVIIAFFPNWMWFKNLDYASVFWAMIIAKFGLAAVIWFLMIVLLAVNLYIAQRLTPAGAQRPTAEIGGFQLSGSTLDNLILAAILVVSFFIAARASEQWNMILSFLNQQPFGTNDPIFNKDIGFYVFSLPFYMFVREQLLILLLFAGLVTVIWYIKDGGVQFIGEVLLADDRPSSLPKVKIAEKVSNHLLALAGIMVILVALGYHLKVYGLLYSTQGPAFGASYTDVHVRIPVFRALMVISLLWSAFLIYNAYRLKMKWLLISGGVWAIAILALGNGLPLLVQQFVVKPNELAKESPFIAHNIEFTRKAYNLNNIKEVDFKINEALSAEEVRGHDVTIQNIRVWDERPLLQTYRQIQAIRLYYDFNNVDVDRYMIGNTYRQVMLAARELVVNQLPPQANTWVNRHLIYTHGYGLAMSPVNEVTSEGLPQLLIKDLPPVSDISLKVDRPEIYYGEKTQEYILVKTSTQEFDFPRGDKNVYTNYQGNGGVAIDSFFKRLLFAIEFQDPQILFTTYLTPESRIMFNRPIKRRVKAVAPFLAYDTDPYMVVSGGRLFWIQDAYTISNMYPYSKRSKNPFRRIGLNYIRNSVKVIIDAYNGDVSYYTIDAQDPVLKTYARIYPALFKPLDQMPADLKKHLRYPSDKFEIQVQTYSRYHMQDIQVFYNQEDLWEPPDEIYGDKRQMMKPYYIIIKLPQDLPNYGNLIVYKLPKDQLVYGPMQIEARIDQQTEISRELSLWDQRGSRVIRGNLLAIPISDAFIYVEPIYLEAKQEAQRPAPVPQSQGGVKPQKQPNARPARKGSTTTAGLPELKRVIVALGNRVVMEERLDRALNRVLEFEIATGRDVSAVMPETGETSDLSSRALEYYYKAKEYLREGDWAGYGRELDKLENILKQMSNTAASSN
jgi:uncharacterized membrane protein (UPF0182 family)